MTNHSLILYDHRQMRFFFDPKLCYPTRASNHLLSFRRSSPVPPLSHIM